MVLLIASDNVQFTTERDIVECSTFMKALLEGLFSPIQKFHSNLTYLSLLVDNDGSDQVDQPIPLPISSSVLKKVLDLLGRKV